MLCWIDLETLGSDSPNNIIEIGAIMTTDDLEEVGDPFHALVRPPAHVPLVRVPAAVLDMHAASGLWDDLAAASRGQGEVMHLDDADAELRDWMTLWCAPPAPTLAGSGVSHFDSALIRDQLPTTWAELKGYNAVVKPTLDIGVVRRFLDTTGQGRLIPDFAREDCPHRALEDVRRFIREARHYRARFDILPGPV